MPMQPGDVYQTYADVEDLFTTTNYKPSMTVEKGVENFVAWYREFYQNNRLYFPSDKIDTINTFRVYLIPHSVNSRLIKTSLPLLDY